MTNKFFGSFFNHQDIMIFDGKKIITIGTELKEVITNHYINLIKKLSGKKTTDAARERCLKY